MLKRKTLYLSLLFVLLAHIGRSQVVFTGKPIYQILTKRAGVYLGTIKVELFPNIAPKHVRNFDSLVNIQFYDTTAFLRVIPGFMIQGGDPNSRHGPKSTWGKGDPPNQDSVPAEFSAARHVRGVLSAARDNSINSANSQFFICVATASWLDGQYSIYGRTTAGMNYVDTIVNSPRDANDNPLQKIEMFVTYIGSNDTVPNVPVLTLPASGTTGVGATKQIRWNKVNDAIMYHVEVSTDSTFATFYKSLDVSNILYTATGLTPNTTYYWRVKTNNGGHFSAWSPVWHFSTLTTGIQNTVNAPTTIVVSPNPGKGQFTFTGIENESTIDIFDLTGRQIIHTISKEEIQLIDLNNKEKGIYLYKVTDRNQKGQLGKLVVM